jgi:hypothetical protein
MNISLCIEYKSYFDRAELNKPNIEKDVEVNVVVEFTSTLKVVILLFIKFTFVVVVVSFSARKVLVSVVVDKFIAVDVVFEALVGECRRKNIFEMKRCGKISDYYLHFVY